MPPFVCRRCSCCCCLSPTHSHTHRLHKYFQQLYVSHQSNDMFRQFWCCHDDYDMHWNCLYECPLWVAKSLVSTLWKYRYEGFWYICPTDSFHIQCILYYLYMLHIYIYIIYTHWHAEWRPIGLATMSVSACLAWSGSSAFSACPRLWMPFCCMSLSAQAFHWATKSTEAILSIGTLTLPTIGEQVRITVIDN